MRRAAWCAALVAVPLVLSACTTSASLTPDAKSGGQSRSEVVVMASDGSTFSDPDSVVNTFAKAIGTRSNGGLRVRVGDTYAASEAPDAESQLVDDLAGGTVDLAVVPSRAFSGAKIPDLDPLEAPFTISSYDAERAVVTAPVARELLDRLDAHGIHGLALAMSNLRRSVVKGHGLVTPEDWAGKTIRAQSSDLQYEVMRALGATPAAERFEWYEAIEDDVLQGAEVDINGVAGRGVGAGYVVNGDLVLWPKIYVVAASEKLWDSLDTEQQRWLQSAALDAQAPTLTADWDETQPTLDACKAGVKVAMTTPMEREELRRALMPVFVRLEQDPLFPQVQAIADAHPGRPLPAPSSCVGAVPNVAPAVETGPPPVVGTPLPPFPDGVYRTKIYESEVVAQGGSNDDGSSGLWTLTFTGGRYRLECQPLTGNLHDCGNNKGPASPVVEAGTVTPLGDGYWITSTPEEMHVAMGCVLPATHLQRDGHCGLPASYTIGPWRLNGTVLTIAPYKDSRVWAFKPWDKIS